LTAAPLLLLLLLLLLQDYERLGKQGDIVTVKAGHARYTLFPQGIADYAIPSVLRDLQVKPAAAAMMVAAAAAEMVVAVAGLG
jgi:ribosomal protein L9